ncbi:VOC family protein [Actinokineospora iranica]|uniref:VOC domain-containing protein n=1 Tax=Actinokineospora iranica TaxID=1271860 RepID=A0A1G6VY45_9PSEU|nr:hypothetical protein [Actinokineospora iranica]SDD57715.1 hypothetical protein SAMN05216174_113125 [Actinokineospora iranica]
MDLGWYVDLGHPSLPGFTADLVAVGHPANPPGLPAVSGSVMALVVEDVRAEIDRLVVAGVPVVQECRDEPWGQWHCYLWSLGPVMKLVQQIADCLAANGW